MNVEKFLNLAVFGLKLANSLIRTKTNDEEGIIRPLLA